MSRSRFHSAADMALRMPVSPATFAFDVIEQVAPDVVRAVVPWADPSGEERGAIASSQAFRHLVNLAVAAAALDARNLEPVVYRPVEARYVRAASSPTHPVDETLLGEALVSWRSSSRATALTKLRTESARTLGFVELGVVVEDRLPGLKCRQSDDSGFELTRIFTGFLQAARHELQEHLGRPVAYRVEEAWIALGPDAGRIDIESISAVHRGRNTNQHELRVANLVDGVACLGASLSDVTPPGRH